MAGKDRYKKSPKIAAKEEKSKPEKDGDKKAKPMDKAKKMDAMASEEETDMGNKGGPKPDVQAGDDAVPVHGDMQVRHGEERKDMSMRQAREMKDMHSRHADEHSRMGKRHMKEMGQDAGSDESDMDEAKEG